MDEKQERMTKQTRKKGAVWLVLALLLGVITLPCFALGVAVDKTTEPLAQSSTAESAPESAAPEPESSAAAPQEVVSTEPEPKMTGSFHILNTETDEVFEVDDRTFVIGTVAAEIAPTYHPEAIKAQAVAAYTYYSSLRQTQAETPNAALKGADFSASPTQGLTYVTKTQLEQRWGDKFAEYYGAIETAVDAVLGQTLQQNGALITATYYAISGGTTEDAKEVFGNARSYLVPVASPGDVYAQGYRTVKTLTAEEFKAAVQNTWGNALEGDPSTWVGTVTNDASGYVASITIGGQVRKGTQARTTFGLRSANFAVTYTDGVFTFDVKGYGHGVGMSQVGAQYMAEQGAAYHEILAWYYPNTELVK